MERGGERCDREMEREVERDGRGRESGERWERGRERSDEPQTPSERLCSDPGGQASRQLERPDRRYLEFNRSSSRVRDTLAEGSEPDAYRRSFYHGASVSARRVRCVRARYRCSCAEAYGQPSRALPNKVTLSAPTSARRDLVRPPLISPLSSTHAPHCPSA